jgi:hypothetical protein
MRTGPYSNAKIVVINITVDVYVDMYIIDYLNMLTFRLIIYALQARFMCFT